MLDYKFIKDNVDLVEENIKIRNVKASAKLVAELYTKRNNIQTQLDVLRNKKNENADKMKQKLSDEDRKKLIEEGKDIKNQSVSFEEEIK